MPTETPAAGPPSRSTGPARALAKAILAASLATLLVATALVALALVAPERFAPATPDSTSETDAGTQIDPADLEPAAAAGGVRVAVLMPFASASGRTGLVRPADHTPALLGGFSWDLHKGDNAAVYANFRSFDGPVTLKVARIASNNNGAGTMLTLDVRVGGTLLGQIRYGHLRNLQVTTSTPEFSPGRLLGYLATGRTPDNRCADGTADGWPYSSSWRVCTESGIHTHTDFQKACWARFPTYAVLPADTAIGMMSTAYPVATNTECDAAELDYVNTDPVADGDFVTYGGHTYRVAGGAPIYVSSWAGFGGAQPTTAYTREQFGTLRRYPVEGTFLRGVPSNRLFRVVGNSPLHVPDLDPGSAPVTDVDDAAIDRIGADHMYDHLTALPAEGTFIRTARRGSVYVVAGGAPVYVSTLDPWGGSGSITFTNVGEQTVTNAGVAGLSGAWQHLRAVPAEGTFLIGKAGGGVYRVAGGSPQWVDSWTPFGGRQPTTAVDDAAIARAGSGGSYDRLSAYPAPGTVLRAVGTDRLYRVAGDAPLHVTSASVLEAGAPAAVDVSAAVLDRAGQPGGNLAHLRAQPVDGTVVTAGGTPYVFAGGAALAGGSATGAVRVDAAALQRAGETAQPWGGHVLGAPRDGTYVRTSDGATTGSVARAAGGTLLTLSSCEALDGCAGAVAVPESSVLAFQAARPRPATGTPLRFVPSGRTVTVTDERCLDVAPTSPEAAAAVAVNDGDFYCDETAPAAPGDVRAVRGDRSAVVSWSTPSDDGGLPVTGYAVTTSPGDVVTEVGPEARSLRLDGLVNGTAYTFTVTATNDAGTSEPSAPSTAVVPAGRALPMAQPYARVVEDDVTLAWLPGDGNGEPVTQYVVRRGSSSGNTYVVVPADRDRIVVENLPRGTYTFTVYATTVLGNSLASPVRTVTVTAGVPAAPARPTTVVKGANVTLSWTPPPASGSTITEYVVRRVGPDGSRYWPVPGANSSLTFRGVAPGTYAFTVYARNGIGTSTPSAAARVTLR
ncbi:fibronectin type III domain-containing protein [Nocardioides alkalitolerans]|uniref:fibronectin type III domain-containing protein n=1 Tax=Nocardioides alkalitolerans TaxID=281714 RepID=UPI00041A63B7|nr:fibronectin type III domain-containing protein [Nocardioides alkalitolerans]